MQRRQRVRIRLKFMKTEEVELTLEERILQYEQLRKETCYLLPGHRQKLRRARILVREEARRVNKLKTRFSFDAPANEHPNGFWDRKAVPYTYDDRVSYSESKDLAFQLPWQGNLFINPVTREKRWSNPPEKRSRYLRMCDGSMRHIFLP